MFQTPQTQQENDAHVLGLCKRQLSFNEIKYYVETNQLERLGRLPADLKIYKETLAKIKEEYQSISDFILHSKFKIPLVEGTVNGGSVKKRVVTPTKEDLEKIIFEVNDFPYAKEDDVSQHLIWSMKPLSEERIISILNDKLPNSEYVYFINPPHLRSIREVYHVHVFSRKK
jgi:hypothetical protein